METHIEDARTLLQRWRESESYHALEAKRWHGDQRKADLHDVQACAYKVCADEFAQMPWVAPAALALEALAFAHGAIVDAIANDDGLDGFAGERVLQMIRAAIRANGQQPPEMVGCPDVTDDDLVFVVARSESSASLGRLALIRGRSLQTSFDAGYQLGRAHGAEEVARRVRAVRQLEVEGAAHPPLEMGEPLARLEWEPREMQHAPRPDCQAEGWHMCVPAKR